MIEVKFKRLHKDAVIPKQATRTAGGWDVVATRIEKVADDFYICYLGFALQPPFNYKVTLVPRSSITKTKWVMQNSPGLGDSDYVLEYQLRFRAFPTGVGFTYKYANPDLDDDKNYFLVYPEFPFKEGDSVGQLYLESVNLTEFIEVNELLSTERLGGFGSTDIK